MASDRLVTPQHVLKALMEHGRRGSNTLLSELEKLEPDLAEYILESQTRLFHQLADLGLSGRDARRLHHRAEKIVLVSITALRNAQRDLWEKDCPDPPAEPSEAPPPSSP